MLIIKGGSHIYYPMTKPLAASKKAHGPVVSVSDSPAGKLTLLHVAKGETLKDGKAAAPARRDLEVLVAHEALGLTAKQGRQLAIWVALGVPRSATDLRHHRDRLRPNAQRGRAGARSALGAGQPCHEGAEISIARM